MENKKKIDFVKEEVKIVSRPSNEELDDEIADRTKEKSSSAKTLKVNKKNNFGQGIED